ncbi:MAG: hypothetical protein Kow00120_03360 [Anaerolineae bacterium]
MQIKLLMTWDIQQGRDQEYFEFLVREWVPGITRLGMQPTESWYTQYGDCPQIMTAGITKDLDTMRRILDSEEWSDLHSRLLQYVNNYEQKIVRATGSFQL